MEHEGLYLQYAAEQFAQAMAKIIQLQVALNNSNQALVNTTEKMNDLIAQINDLKDERADLLRELGDTEEDHL